MIRPAARYSLLTLAALTTLLGYVGVAAAAPVLGATSTATANGAAGPTSPYTQPGYINSYSQANDAAGRGFGYSFANQYGAYAVSSRADGKIGRASCRERV